VLVVFELRHDQEIVATLLHLDCSVVDIPPVHFGIIVLIRQVTTTVRRSDTYACATASFVHCAVRTCVSVSTQISDCATNVVENVADAGMSFA